MATVYKNAQLQGTAGLTTYATLYNTAANKTAVISSIVICNTSAASKQYRIAIDTQTATAPAADKWVAYDATLAANDTISLTWGVALSNSQFLRVSSTDTTLTFSAHISEIT